MDPTILKNGAAVLPPYRIIWTEVSWNLLFSRSS
jgi:hypothetical protein